MTRSQAKNRTRLDSTAGDLIAVSSYSRLVALAKHLNRFDASTAPCASTSNAVPYALGRLRVIACIGTPYVIYAILPCLTTSVPLSTTPGLVHPHPDCRCKMGTFVFRLPHPRRLPPAREGLPFTDPKASRWQRKSAISSSLDPPNGFDHTTMILRPTPNCATFPHPLEPRQRVLEMDRGVVAQEQPVARPLRRRQVHHHQHVRGLLAGDDPLTDHVLRQPGLCDGHPVLHVDPRRGRGRCPPRR